MAPSFEDKIKNLKIRREDFKRLLQDFDKMLEAQKVESQAVTLKRRFALEAEYTTIQKIQVDLDSADEDGGYFRERMEIRSCYMESCNRAYELLEATNIRAATEATASSHPDRTDHSSQFTVPGSR